MLVSYKKKIKETKVYIIFINLLIAKEDRQKKKK